MFGFENENNVATITGTAVNILSLAHLDDFFCNIIVILFLICE